ncbi:MAG TPA: four helix bundle protein [Anaerolineae bacterium]|nr:four helix bundle protein [Anaerolineae bacterium]
MGTRGLDSLEVWQVARKLAVFVCSDVLPKLPPEEKWSLITQLRRSVQSIPANIAEGFGRYYFQEGVRFCYIARGSLDETYSQLCIARDLGYIDDEIFVQVIAKTNELRRLLNGYIAFLKRSKRGSDEPGAHLSVREFELNYDALDEMDMN